MEETFYNTELKNKIKKSEKQRGKKTWPPWNKSSILRRERNTAEHRWGWCPFCVLCVSVCNSFRIAAVRAGATGAATPGLRGAAAAEPGRASGGSWAGFLCGEEGSDGIICKELKQKRFAHSLHPPRLPSQLHFARAAYLPAAFACCNKACPANGWQSFSGCRWPWKSGIRTGALREGNVLHSPTVLKVRWRRALGELCPQPCVLQCNLWSQETLPGLCEAGRSLFCTGTTFSTIFHTIALHGGLGFF